MRSSSGFQFGLFSSGAIVADASFLGVEHRALSAHSWVDFAPTWLRGADSLCTELLELVPWKSHHRWMYDRRLVEPRLTEWYGRSAELPHRVIREIFEMLDPRYGVHFDSVGLNLYRSGSDSVAWHGDRVGRGAHNCIVAIVSVGESRPFRLRPKGGGRSITWELGGGDLLVMGGRAQHEFEHCVPKVAVAGPRISVTFRQASQGPVL